jgi:hypothetical protein
MSGAKMNGGVSFGGVVGKNKRELVGVEQNGCGGDLREADTPYGKQPGRGVEQQS